MRTQTITTLLLGLPLAAYGYTDPGTGVFVYQAIMAAMVGAGWAARRFIARLMGRTANRPTVASD